jgi:type IV pilus assembly protein PilF
MLKRSPWFLVSLCLCFCVLGCATNTAEHKRQAQASMRLGESFLSQGNATAALRELLKAEAVLTENYLLQNDLGLAYSEKGQMELALQHFKKAVDLKPDFPGAWNNMGTVYLKMEHWDDAIKSFDKALDQLLYATPHFALNNLGEAYRGKKDYQRSIDAYRQAIKVEPRYFRAHRGLGLTYIAMGDYEAAISSLEKAVDLAPDYAPAYYDLGCAYAGRYNRKKALAAFKKVVELVPDSLLAEDALTEIRKLQ